LIGKRGRRKKISKKRWSCNLRWGRPRTARGFFEKKGEGKFKGVRVEKKVGEKQETKEKRNQNRVLTCGKKRRGGDWN